jgi:hypothetical protein
VPQPAQSLCGSFGSPQWEQFEKDVGVNASCARLFLVREWECRLLGNAISTSETIIYSLK